MSNALLYIEILSDTPQHFEKPLFNTLKQENPTADTFDIDNFSDPLLISYAIEMIRRSNKTVVVILATSETTPGKLLPLFENLIKNKNTCLALLKGNNPITSKMLKLMETQYLQTDEEKIILENIFEFLEK